MPKLLKRSKMGLMAQMEAKNLKQQYLMFVFLNATRVEQAKPHCSSFLKEKTLVCASFQGTSNTHSRHSRN